MTPVPPAAAREFCLRVLTRALEVLDRRRPVSHLTLYCVGRALDDVRCAPLGDPGRPPGTSRLHRVRLHAGARPDRLDLTATYLTGERVRAIAGRIELAGGHWRLSSLLFV